MKRIWKEILCALVMGMGLPWFVVGMGRAAIPPETTPPATEVTQQLSQPRQVNVYIGNTVTQMPLTEYLTGVLLCELPGDFHMEAKKAQAVVARTYTLRTVTLKDKHPGNAVCTDPGCCQGYRSVEAYLAAGGSREAVQEAEAAVSQTEGQVLTYAGQLIDATYFSCSGGQTEDAVAVWGAEIPYLQSVSSPGEEQATHYTDTVTFTAQQFQSALGVKLSGKPATWLGTVTYTEGGGVDTMSIGGTVYKGTTLRAALGLRSTAFVMTAVGDSMVITTKGYGHRVGMSQYGADAMAVSGCGFEEILIHYYQGAILTQMEN